VTLREDIDERTERMQRIITEDRGHRLHPRVSIVGTKGKVLESHALPAGAYLVVDAKSEVLPATRWPG